MWTYLRLGCRWMSLSNCMMMLHLNEMPQRTKMWALILRMKSSQSPSQTFIKDFGIELVEHYKYLGTVINTVIT